MLKYVTLLLDLSHLVLFIVHRNDFIFQSHVLCMHNIAGLRLYRDEKKLPVDTTVLLYVLLILNSPSLQNQRLREIAVAVFPRSVMTTLSNSHGRALSPPAPPLSEFLGAHRLALLVPLAFGTTLVQKRRPNFAWRITHRTTGPYLCNLWQLETNPSLLLQIEHDGTAKPRAHTFCRQAHHPVKKEAWKRSLRQGQSCAAREIGEIWSSLYLVFDISVAATVKGRLGTAWASQHISEVRQNQHSQASESVASVTITDCTAVACASIGSARGSSVTGTVGSMGSATSMTLCGVTAGGRDSAMANAEVSVGALGSIGAIGSTESSGRSSSGSISSVIDSTVSSMAGAAMVSTSVATAVSSFTISSPSRLECWTWRTWMMHGRGFSMSCKGTMFISILPRLLWKTNVWPRFWRWLQQPEAVQGFGWVLQRYTK